MLADPCAPWTTAFEDGDGAPQPSPLPKLLREERVPAFRNLYCTRYDDCLEEAVARSWTSWSCGHCARFTTGAAARLARLTEGAAARDGAA
jgi:hypothetical protein